MLYVNIKITNENFTKGEKGNLVIQKDQVNGALFRTRGTSGREGRIFFMH